MKKTLLISLSAGALVASSAQANLLIEVGYDFSVSSINSSPSYAASPDSAFVKISSTGGSVFIGEAKLDAPFAGGNYGSSTGAGYTLGSTVVLVPGPESSNVGGFNKVSGGPDNGILLSIIGTLDGCPLNFQIYDKDIHSGTFAVNPFGISLDNYILQGGDPFGRDTGDAFEIPQAHAFITLSGHCVPDAGSSAALLGGALAGLSFIRRQLAARA